MRVEEAERAATSFAAPVCPFSSELSISCKMVVGGGGCGGCSQP